MLSYFCICSIVYALNSVQGRILENLMLSYIMKNVVTFILIETKWSVQEIELFNLTVFVVINVLMWKVVYFPSGV